MALSRDIPRDFKKALKGSKIVGMSLAHKGLGTIAALLNYSNRRSGRVDDRGGLENRCTLMSTVGSNPTSSAISKCYTC